MDIRIGSPDRPEIRALLSEHLQSMTEHSPAESIHALPLGHYNSPKLTLWGAWDNQQLLGTGALMELSAQHAEIKSMRTATQHLRRGVASALLTHILGIAAERGYQQLSLETGTAPAFKPAQQLYLAFGFEYCGPFGDYVEDPYSTFMSLKLT